MTALARRILLCAIASIAGLGILAIALTITHRNIDNSVQGQADLAAAERLWQLSLTDEADRARSRVIAAIVGATSNQPGNQAGSAQLDDAVLTGLASAGMRSLILYDEIGQPSLSWPSTAQTPAVDTLRVSQLLTGHASFESIQFSGNSAFLIAGGFFPKITPGRADFVAEFGAAPLLTRITGILGGSAFILDSRQHVGASKGTLNWSDLSEAFAARHENIFDAAIDPATVQVTVLPLRETNQGVAGYVVLAHDVTRQSHLFDVEESLSVAAVVTLCLILALSLQWLTSRSFGPMGVAINAMSALADGDTGVEVLGTGRPGEIGLMARSIQVFRDQVRRLRDTEDRRLRQWSRQQEFIRVQMMQLADTLPEDGRQAFIADLNRIEQVTGAQDSGEGATRSLAVVFEVMAGRVSDQYRKLEELVRELKAALSTRNELVQLQQQVEVARRMQETMLPRDFVPPPGIEVTGALLPAEGFDGGFYDYLALEDGRLAITIGQPADGGIASGFVSATARTSLRVLLLAELSPADCLQRTATLLAKEEAANGYALAAAIIDPSEGLVTWAAAGIESPFLVRRLGDAVDVPLEATAALDGANSRAFTDQTFPLPHRAAAVVCSPGMLSSVNAAGGTIGRQHVADLLREADDMSSGGLAETLRRGLLAHSRGSSGIRDRLCVVFRVGA